MKKLKKQIMAFFMALALILSNGILVFAEEGDVLNPYREKLTEINTRLGTEYKIPDEDEIQITGMTYSDLQDFYINMTLEEFERYVHQLHSQNDKEKVIEVAPVVSDSNQGIALAATASSQYYYYSSSNSNFLALHTNVVQSGGVTYYNSVRGYGANSRISGYPYYSPYDLSYSPSSDSRQISCSFKCSKYISANLIDTGIYTLRVTFTAGGGNIYA